MLPPPVPWTALIPIRGGSKGLPGKNTRAIAGKPLYRHAVDLAISAGAHRTVVSTDIPEVLAATLPAGVTVLRRPAELCGDDVPMAPVVLQALEAARVTGPVVLLQATSPLRVASDVVAALELLQTRSYDLVMSVTEADRGVLKWGHVDHGRFIPLSSPEHCFSNRQKLPAVYRPNGAVYAFDAQWFVDNGGFVTERLGVVVMPPERSFDIDTAQDFERCEALLQH